MQVELLPAAPLPGGVKVARRFVKPHGVGASPTLAANFWKAGRYKLAAPVSKTGSASPRSERYRRLPPTINPGGPMDDTITIAHAVFHIIVFFVVHRHLARRRIRIPRNPKQRHRVVEPLD